MLQPVFIATWPFGVPASRAGYACLTAGGSAVDAVEVGANVAEDDPEVNSVGTGGLPNADGVVELDAAIMNGYDHAAGSVAGLTDTARPISVARKIMETSPHVMLVGQNAVRFARAAGFAETATLTPEAAECWEEWKRNQTDSDVAHFNTRRTVDLPLTPESHDTIGVLALDTHGNLAAGCTTSGMAWKTPGRVGDSPIIGSGLYVDNRIGAAAATGHGDEMMKAVLSYRVVMLMEQGCDPQEACIEALRYLIARRPPENHNRYGAAIIALRKDGRYGAAATLSGFVAPDRLWTWASADAEGVVQHEGPYATPDAVVAHLKP